jgi:phage baseplate assembly protein W
MATYSFKSAGKTQEQTQIEVVQKTQTPFGIRTPLALGSSEGILAMNYSLEDQFADNLRNLLLTNWGERLGLYRFGANLKPLTTEIVSQEDFDNKAIENIRTAVSTWMPFIELEDFTSQVDRNENTNTGIIRITITYNIPVLKVNKKGLQIVLYVI